MEGANRALGRLDGVATLLPETPIFLYAYVRKEALLSSQIEGTQSTLSDLLLYESKEVPGVPMDDVEEVSTYVAAMNHGLKRLRGGFPLSLRLIREIHKVLLSTGRGSNRAPGEFRTSQNWIGGTRPGNARYVPPPPDRVTASMGLLEKFLHDDPVKTPLLIKAALSHVQFETIHPFLDGNGRLGRLLITLLLCAEKALSQPMLYLSLYFKAHRERYYELLQRVRTRGDWDSWLRYFINGVQVTAADAVKRTTHVIEMREDFRKRVGDKVRALALVDQLFTNPYVTVAHAMKALDVTYPTALKVIDLLVERKLIQRFGERRWGKLYVCKPVLEAIEQK